MSTSATSSRDAGDSNSDNSIDDVVYVPAGFPPDVVAALHARRLRLIGPGASSDNNSDAHTVSLDPAALDADPHLARSLRCIAAMGRLPPGLHGADPATAAAILDRLPRLSLICSIGSGYNESVPLLPLLRERNIAVTNAHDGGSSCVADYCMAMVLASTRRLLQADRFVRAGAWLHSRTPTLGGAFRQTVAPRGLGELRLGVLGLGAIGSKVAKRAAAFEMKVGYCTRTRRPEADPEY
ncbi:hypothetical protein HK405_015602, partial [Cladochytrium tenue]